MNPSDGLLTVAALGSGRGHNPTRPLGNGRYFALVAKNQKRQASVLHRGSLSRLVLFRHALCVQGVGDFPLWPRPPSTRSTKF
jgi:hypothetical protein